VTRSANCANSAPRSAGTEGRAEADCKEVDTELETALKVRPRDARLLVRGPTRTRAAASGPEEKANVKDTFSYNFEEAG